MGNRDRSYWFEGLAEMDDAFVGGRKPGKRGRGSEGKKPVIFAVEQQEKGMGFMAARLVKQVNSEQVREFAKRISPHSEIRTDVFKALRVLGESHRHKASLDEWLPKVHIVISNFKSFFTGYRINTFRNTLTNLCFASIANSGNLSCRTDRCKSPSIMCQFEYSLNQFRCMLINYGKSL